jgi:hypothetical protein
MQARPEITFHTEHLQCVGYMLSNAIVVVAASGKE